MKTRLKKIIKTTLVAALIVTVMFSGEETFAKTSSDLKKEADDTQSEINKANEKKEELINSKESMEEYLSQLNTKLQNISENIVQLESDLANKKQEISDTQTKLQSAKDNKEKQYNDMKKRIKFMYEKGNASYIEIILASDDFADLLNRVEYISQITEYDRDMLEKYEDTVHKIADMETELETEQASLEDLKQQSEDEQAAELLLIEDTTTQISKYSSQIENANKQISSYESELEKKEAQIAQKEQEEKEAEEARIAAQKAKEEQERQQQAQAAQNNSSNNKNEPIQNSNSGIAESAGDQALLAALIECEAGGESYEAQLAVGSVVINRVNSGSFPNSVLGVIYQSGQFTPVSSGRFAVVLGRGASSSCVSAAQAAMSGNSNIGSMLYFRTAGGDSNGTVIGNMLFY